MIEELRAKARELLETEEVDCVIGYEVGPAGTVRPAFVYEPGEVERLIFNEHCDHNLVTYLHRRNKPPKKGEDVPTTAIVVKSCDARALQVVLNENQVQRDKVRILGVACAGMETADGGVEVRCQRCGERVPHLYDALFGEPPAVSDVTDDYADLAELEGMSREERLDYWMEAFDRCIRCYACRQACPACFCEVCEAERDDGMWIGIADRVPEKMFFHVIRAFHLAGRCADCSICETACPMGIPLSLLNRQLAREIEQTMGGYRAGVSEAPTPLVTKLTGKEDIDEVHK